mgnify:FL=1
MGKFSDFVLSLKEIVVVYILQYIVILGSSYIYLSIDPKGDVTGFLTTMGYILLILFDIIVAIYLYLRNKRKEKKVKVANYFPIVYLGIGMAVVLNMLIFLFNLNNEMADLNIYLAILSSGIIGPILEEILFRYVFLNRLRNFFTTRNAILLSSLVFALLHGDIITMIYAFIMGFIFAYVYVKYDNIKVSIMCHISANTIVIFLTSFNIWILLLGLFGVWISIYLILRDNKRKVLVS